MKILCSRCNQPFDGPICPRCGQAVATSGAGYTNMAPPPVRPKKRVWVGLTITGLFALLRVACNQLGQLF